MDYIMESLHSNNIPIKWQGMSVIDGLSGFKLLKIEFIVTFCC